MAKQLDKEMLRLMTITERFNYIAAKKQMQMTINQSSKSKRGYSDDSNSSDGGKDSSGK